jgi:hypothetical protein
MPISKSQNFHIKSLVGKWRILSSPPVDRQKVEAMIINFYTSYYNVIPRIIWHESPRKAFKAMHLMRNNKPY